MISKELTGHLYFGSAYESCNSCGTCNGARCDYCEISYVVWNTEDNRVKRFYTLEEAEAADNK